MERLENPLIETDLPPLIIVLVRTGTLEGCGVNNTALIVAAGSGTRAVGNSISRPSLSISIPDTEEPERSDDSIPKQYRNLGGKKVLTHGLYVFIKHPAINAVQVVIRPNDIGFYDLVMDELVGLTDKIYPPIYGGSTRQESVWRGLQTLNGSRTAFEPGSRENRDGRKFDGVYRRRTGKTPDRILIHDAARPFVDAPLIDRVLAGLGNANGVIPGIRVADTLKRIKDYQVEDTVDRKNLYQIQTPQGFTFQHIFESHRKASEKQRFDFTDDAAIAEHSGYRVVVVEGSKGNSKITDREDLDRAKYRLGRNDGAAMASIRVGTGYDVHRFADQNEPLNLGNQISNDEQSVMLCGVLVPHDRPLIGHSDADVGLHALTDAILGAICDGDIGTHFPPSDSQWKGCSSDTFLKDALNRVLKLRGTIEHVDVTLICERPKIAPHRIEMSKRIAEILNIEPHRVSVKATTTEGLGFTGRREGIAAMASATIVI